MLFPRWLASPGQRFARDAGHALFFGNHLDIVHSANRRADAAALAIIIIGTIQVLPAAFDAAFGTRQRAQIARRALLVEEQGALAGPPTACLAGLARSRPGDCA